jgi:error-prone DNA polymerase
MVHPYLNRRLGREPVETLHPLLESTLARTLGVPLFQEQLLRMAMIVAGFTGGEAEELRRAFGFKRSEARMKEVEVKLRRGMDSRGITGETQDKIILSITSFALYGFPESHAASFALLAYASAYLKCHYLAAFTTAMLNNQPMGFYSPATLIKDAQRHGLQFKPIDVTRSNWECTIEEYPEGLRVRVGLRYVKGLRKEISLQLVEQRFMRAFLSIDDLKQRVPQIHVDELRVLASVGALNFISGEKHLHRRDALWQVESASRSVGPLIASKMTEEAAHPEPRKASPLAAMTPKERVFADFHGTGLTVGPHPLAQYRKQLAQEGVVPASLLKQLPDGKLVIVVGAVITRQRPGTAKGFVFLSLEDETGVANIIISPQQFEREHRVVVHNSFLRVRGVLQNQDGVISVKAGPIEAFHMADVEIPSHDFH